MLMQLLYITVIVVSTTVKQAHEVCEGQNELIMSSMTVLKIFRSFFYDFMNFRH
jgi:hypothetical protein